MKFKFTLFVLAILSAQAYSQSKNSISIQYGSTWNDVDIHGIMGDFGYRENKGNVFSLNYARILNPSFSLETGIQYNYNKVELSTIGPRGALYDGEIKLITIPVIAKYTFFKYLFVDGGLLAGFETNYASSDANSTATMQTGIGYELGLGAKYNFGPVQIFVNPFIQEHSFIKFNRSSSNFNLMNWGFKFGLGYNF
jgi:hypothetical protein